MTTDFLAGAASRIITPTLGTQPVFLAGFQNNRCATAVHSELYARALALRLDEQALVLVACDLIGLGRPDVDDIRAALAAAGVQAELVVACTHTHSGPDTIGLWGPVSTVSGVDAAYLAALKQAIVAVAEEALTFCCPVRLRCTTTALPGYIANYRTPGLVDDELTALQFENPDGEVVATLLNLACHPEVLNETSFVISSDYAGAACQVVEAAVGGMAIHISGALGGMLSPAIAQRNAAGVAAMGRAYAEAALQALTQAPLADISRLEIRRIVFDLPLANPIFTMAQAIGIVRPRDSSDHLSTTCSYVDLGLAQLIGLPGELLPRLGLELKAALPGPARVLIGLADDELGYILPDNEFVMPADYMYPGAHYEESMSPGPHTGSLVLDAAKGLIANQGAHAMNITIRPAALPQEYPAIAAVLKSDNPSAATADELAYDDATRDPRYHHATFVAEVFERGEQLVVGVAFVGNDPLAHHEGTFEIDLRVHLDWQGHGVGKALYRMVIDHLATLAAHEITSMVWQAHPRAARFLIDRGFAEVWQRADSSLDVTNFDWTPYAGLEERVRALGIEVTTYAALDGDPARLEKLYELDWMLWQDIPYGQAVSRRSLEQFAAAEVHHPRFLPDACFIAVKDGEFVGYSNLITAQEGFDTDMTGVLRPYRGKAVATLLKLRGIRYAQEHGGQKLWVVNDSVNTVMLGLNAKLGFVRGGVNVRYLKVIA